MRIPTMTMAIPNPEVMKKILIKSFITISEKATGVYQTTNNFLVISVKRQLVIQLKRPWKHISERHMEFPLQVKFIYSKKTTTFCVSSPMI